MKRLALFLLALAALLLAALSATAYQCDKETRVEAAALKGGLARGKPLPEIKAMLEKRGMRYTLVSDAHCRKLAVDFPGTCLGGPILMSDHWVDCKACRTVQSGHIAVDVRFDKVEQAVLYNVTLTPNSVWVLIRARVASLLSIQIEESCAWIPPQEKNSPAAG